MNKIINKQLEILKSKYQFEEKDGNFVFHSKKETDSKDHKKIVFEDYFITGFPGFDFHDKYNNGVAPFAKVMYGEILKETEKMYYVSVHSDSSDKRWVGWVPKKSCTVS